MIADLRPRTLTGCWPAKAVVGHEVRVSADVFREGTDRLRARCRWRLCGAPQWQEAHMAHLENDRWSASFEPASIGLHEFVVEAWTDRISTWQHDLTERLAAGNRLDLELEEGCRLLRTRSKDSSSATQFLLEVARTIADTSIPLDDRLSVALDPEVSSAVARVPDSWDSVMSEVYRLWVDRERAQYGAWYEMFPRSEGGLIATAVSRLPGIAAMGFDVVYLPPIHPIGVTYRKGRNNTLASEPGDPGSPWAIGSADGGHTAIDPNIGTIDDFDTLIQSARGLGLEIALDYALQCSPEHPWVTAHPEWFFHRPDGSIRYAENPPKKYQDVYPINFWPSREEEREALWAECKGIIDFWVSHGVQIFRVDNPHTKPVAFWSWLISSVQSEHPDVTFLSEAFTKPKMMAKLAEVGFSQSYTYFTWRTEKWELQQYLQELAHGPTSDYMRPNFWPNTHDILSGPLRNGPKSAFALRVVLAATMVPSYGIYSGYELCENVPASSKNEDYLNSEKYELRPRDWRQVGSLAPLISRLNAIRRRHPAFFELKGIFFHHSDNDQILVYSKRTADRSDVVLMVINLDPYHTQVDTLWLDLEELGMPRDRPYVATDELTGEIYNWAGPAPYVALDPNRSPAHILRLQAG